MLATGCRIGEALAVRYGLNGDGRPLLDLDAGTWEVDATVVRVRGQGLIVQPRPVPVGRLGLPATRCFWGRSAGLSRGMPMCTVARIPLIEVALDREPRIVRRDIGVVCGR